MNVAVALENLMNTHSVLNMAMLGWPEILVILVILAFMAVVVAHFADAPIWDGIGTLSIGILLLVIAAVLIVEMRSLLIGEGADKRDMDKILSAINSTPRVSKLIHIKTQHLGPEELLVAAKIHFDDGLSVSELANAVNDVERRIRAEVPYARPMYIEPGLGRDPQLI